MVVIMFDATTLLEQRTDGIAQTDSDSWLRYSTKSPAWEAWREVSIQLNVANEDLLRTRPPQFLPKDVNSTVSRVAGSPISVIGAARVGLYTLRQVSRVGYARLSIGETSAELVFKLQGSDILIFSNDIMKTVSISYSQLLAAWLDFDERVRGFLKEHFPEVLDDPQLKPWIENGEELEPIENPYLEYVQDYEHYFTQVDAREENS